MNRGPAYTDTNANTYTASQRQPMDDQRMQMNHIPNNYSGRAESFPAEVECPYASANTDRQWQWDRDAQQMSPQLYSGGQGSYASKSFSSSQIPEIKLGPNQESRSLSQEQDRKVGYEDNPTPQTLEGLEQKFRDDITKLMKEQDDSEDAETVRHREKINDINNQHQEKVTALRGRYATRREEFFRKESQARLHQCQLAGVESIPNNTLRIPNDLNHGHRGYSEAHREYGGGQFDSYRHPESLEQGRMQGGVDTRIPTPGGGRVYNAGSRYY